jgi:NlpC/P60 family putative phage cell wall peptidase
MPIRTHIVAIARTWLGTPYHHQASMKGVGTDCIGLVRGIWRELYGPEPQALPAYTRDWAEAQARETLLEAARRHLVELDPTTVQPGCVLIFRWRRTAPAKHCAILAGPPLPACGERVGVRGSRNRDPIVCGTMIHALEGAPVCEVSLSPWWHRHLAAAFMFPALGSLVEGNKECEKVSPSRRICLPKAHQRLAPLMHRRDCT